MGQVVRFPVEDRLAAIEEGKQRVANAELLEKMRRRQYRFEPPSTLRIILTLAALPLIFVLGVAIACIGTIGLFLLCCYCLYIRIVDAVAHYKTGDPN